LNFEILKNNQIMKLRLGFSTCPNDTFIFDAMIHNKIDCEGLSFDLLLADVEVLNKEAINNKIDITKISYFAYTFVAQNYLILDSGSALGKKNGPLLVSKKKIYPDEVDNLKIAIPGKHTTANLLLSIAYPNAKNKIEYLFSDIEEVVLSNETDAGLIIHENRFTYEQKGLKKIVDLGEFWEQKTGLSIPLGGIIVNRNLSFDLQQKINRVLQRSVEYAFKYPLDSLEFIRKYAQDMNEEIMYKHINLYVNEFTRNLGKDGKNSILKLYDYAKEYKIIKDLPEKIFFND